jgi:tRNA threonylcarbamoyl adenosine modification protein (Sua5/YciO/YrdC/YwlC family)
MSQFFDVHPENPQPRLLKQAVQLLERGGVLAVPTDSSYALVCHLDDKAAADRLRRIRQVDDKHHLTLLCRDLSELASYAKVDNRQYRLLKLATPGAYTFILEASKEVPRRLSHPSRKTIGLRVPEHRTLQALLDLHNAPLLATTLILPGETDPLNDAHDIRDRLEHDLAGVIDAGACALEPTTVIDLTAMGDGGEPEVVRTGQGALARLGLCAARGAASPTLGQYAFASSATRHGFRPDRSNRRPLRHPGAVRHHAARSGARLRGKTLRRQHGPHARPDHGQPA